MLNTLSLVYINSALYSSSFFFGKFPEDYDFLNLIVDVIPVMPLFFSIGFCLASCCKFLMRSQIA